MLQRKLLVVVAVTVFASPHAKANAVVIVLALAGLHLAYILPYSRDLHNKLAITALASCFLVLLGSTARKCKE